MSDEADFRNLIEIYEKNKGEHPLFLFNVTMQNHGGCTADHSRAGERVKAVDEKLDIPQLTEYLSLIRESDEAFRNLVSYFEKTDRKTVILMFGDHQPGMDDEVYQILDPDYYEDEKAVEKLDQRLVIPYILYANYPLEGPEEEFLSANYLRQFLMKNAGIPFSPYDSLVSRCVELWPGINRYGFYDRNGMHHVLDEADRIELLSDYKICAYNNLLDHRNVEMDAYS